MQIPGKGKLTLGINPKTLDKLQFRMALQSEEHDELAQAIHDKDAEEVVDALIDTIWIACGTLDLLGVDFDRAYKEVARANMEKERGSNCLQKSNNIHRNRLKTLAFYY
jgi:predicted HAD superfamily Cof-like phosphohydrolase